MDRRLSIPLALLSSLAALLGCAACAPRAGVSAANAPSAAPIDSNLRGHVLSAVVSIQPQAYFVERVGGDRVKVTVLVGPGQEPHTFEPTPETMTGVSTADVFFTIGLPFEATLLDKLQASVPKLHVVDTRQGITLQPLDAGAAGQGDLDPHIWLSPRLVKLQARTIRDALVNLDPSGKADFDRNLRDFEADLDALDRETRKRLAPFKGRELLVFHPSFGYFARDYGLRQVNIETEGKEPGPRELTDIINAAKQSGVKVILVEPQFSSKSAEAVAQAIGGSVMTVDPLARDWLPNFSHVVGSICLAVGGEAR